MAKNAQTRNRVATSQRRQQNTRDRMIEALNISSARSSGASDGAKIKMPSTYGNYTPTKSARGRALNNAYGTRKRPARSGK